MKVALNEAFEDVPEDLRLCKFLDDDQTVVVSEDVAACSLWHACLVKSEALSLTQLSNVANLDGAFWFGSGETPRAA